MKILVVTGGVLSGLGKGVAGASLGFLLSNNLNIVPIKLDGYLNSDPGTMNPIEHGEVFVLDDGSEVDMDFGHYERFLNDISISEQSITMGKIYYEIWKREREGKYLGKTVQLIPHVTDLIKKKILDIGEKKKADILLVEVGGTIGDLETELFVEALRQLKSNLSNKNDIVFVHLTYVPIPYGVKEQKTKPTQQSVRLLKEKGISPDFILARCATPLLKKNKEKIALFADLKVENIISAPDVDNIYKIPIIFEEQGLGYKIAEKFNLDYKKNIRYNYLNEALKKKHNKNINIVIAGKYTDLEDSYASIIEAIKHCELKFEVDVNIKFLDSSKKIDFDVLTKADGVIVPGGFGERGVEGKIQVIEYIRENNIPFLGICYGMQLAVVEFARHVCNLSNANTTEIDKNTEHPIISLLDEQKNITDLGGTMRLGAYDAIITESKIKNVYVNSNNYKIENNKYTISERHRHRYEVNPVYHKILESNGLKIVGKGKNGLAEFIEIPNLKYFVGTQGHPELKSKPDNPAPLFYGLFEAILK